MKKKYSDFIGVKIQIEINPFQFDSKKSALEFELKKRIKNELTYFNGLLCTFKDVECVIDNKIIVYGTVIQCEVDC